MSQPIKESNTSSNRTRSPSGDSENRLKAASQNSSNKYKCFPKTILKTFESNPAFREQSKINLSDFYTRLSVFVDSGIQIDDLPFDPNSETITGDLNTIAEKLKELALLYSDLKIPDDLSPLQQIDHFYTFLMSKFHPEQSLDQIKKNYDFLALDPLQKTTAPVFELPSLSINISNPEEPPTDFKPNTVWQELIAMVKNPKNWLKFLVLLAICVFTFHPAIFIPVIIIIFTIAVTINHFVGVEETNRKWRALKKLKDVAKQLVETRQSQPVPQAEPVQQEQTIPIQLVRAADQPVSSTASPEREPQSPVSAQSFSSDEEEYAHPHIDIPVYAPPVPETDASSALNTEPQSPFSVQSDASISSEEEEAHPLVVINEIAPPVRETHPSSPSNLGLQITSETPPSPQSKSFQESTASPKSPVSSAPVSPSASSEFSDSDDTKSLMSLASSTASTGSEALRQTPSYQAALDDSDSIDPKPDKTILKRLAGRVKGMMPTKIKNGATNTLTWIRSKLPRNPFQSSPAGI